MPNHDLSLLILAIRRISFRWILTFRFDRRLRVPLESLAKWRRSLKRARDIREQLVDMLEKARCVWLELVGSVWLGVVGLVCSSFSLRWLKASVWSELPVG